MRCCSLALVYTFNLYKQFGTTFLKFHIDKTYNEEKKKFTTQTSSLFRKAEQISYFQLLEHLDLEL